MEYAYVVGNLKIETDSPLPTGSLCIDGNKGVFNNHLTGNALNQFNTALSNMMINCMRSALMNNLNNHYGVAVNSGDGSYGTFNPCDYSISLNPDKNIDAYTLTGDFFHAYQEQFLNGKLREIQLDVDNNHIGGSNIEFEEKAINIIAGYFSTGSGDAPGTQKLRDWCNNFILNHPIHSNVTLTQAEIDSWFEALEYFRDYCIAQGYSNYYVKPIDYTMLPTSLLSLWNLSDCEF